ACPIASIPKRDTDTRNPPLVPRRPIPIQNGASVGVDDGGKVSIARVAVEGVGVVVGSARAGAGPRAQANFSRHMPKGVVLVPRPPKGVVSEEDVPQGIRRLRAATVQRGACVIAVAVEKLGAT